MTRIFALIILCCTAFGARAQTGATVAETPKPAVYASAKEGWLVDLDEAYELSQKTKKPILANFTGSDWCGWCKRLDADVFTKPEFKTWAQNNVILLELDFPRAKIVPAKNQGQNAAMAKALSVTAYPTIFVLDIVKIAATGQYQIEELGRTGYNPSAEQFIGIVDKFAHP